MISIKMGIGDWYVIVRILCAAWRSTPEQEGQEVIKRIANNLAKEVGLDLIWSEMQ